MTGPTHMHVPTRAECIAAAAQVLIAAAQERAAQTPRQVARAAYYPGHPLGSVEAIEAAYVRRRARQQSLLVTPSAA